MNRRQWQRLFEEHPHKDLRGKYIAFGISGDPLGVAVYKRGVLVSRKKIKEAQDGKEGIQVR